MGRAREVEHNGERKSWEIPEIFDRQGTCTCDRGNRPFQFDTDGNSKFIPHMLSHDTLFSWDMPSSPR